MYTLKKAGPRMDACGTPNVDLRIPDISEPTSWVLQAIMHVAIKPF